MSRRTRSTNPTPAKSAIQDDGRPSRAADHLERCSTTIKPAAGPDDSSTPLIHTAITAAANAARKRPLAPGRVRTAAENYRHLFDNADPGEQQLLADAVFLSVGANLEADLWGQAPTAAETSAAELTQLRMRFADRDRVIQSALTRKETAELLGITEHTVTRYLAKGDLVGLKAARRWMLPAWQFDADLERGIVPGIARLRQAFPGGVASLTRWVTRPSADLNTRTPRDALRASEIDRVVGVASALTAAGW